LHGLVGILQAAERHLLRFFCALADDHDVDFLADSRIGHHAGQVLWFLDLLAAELDDDVAGFDARGFGRALVVDARNQGAASRFNVEAFGDLVSDLLDADAESAPAELAELA